MGELINELGNALRQLEYHPDHNRLLAEYRYLLIRACSRFQKKEQLRLGNSYRAKRALIDFCGNNGVTPQSLYRYRRNFKEYGITGLVPKYGIQNRSPKQTRCKKVKSTFTAKIEIESNAPLRCLRYVKEAIENQASIAPEARAAALAVINHYSNSIKKPWAYKKMSLGRDLEQCEIIKLKQYQKKGHKNECDKARALLLAAESLSALEISLRVHRSIPTVYRWISNFRKSGIKFVETRLDYRKNNSELHDRTNRIVKILHKSPKEYNINRSAWNMEGIADAYRQDYGKSLSLSSIRRSIKETSYTWRRAKKVLTSPDPYYVQKVEKLLEILHGLNSDEVFFFLDEAGPWPVKKYGGKTLTLKGELKTFPQYQKPKGSVLLIGALDAIKNQVHWLFIPKKDSKAVIALIKILFYRHNKFRNLYVTWDRASWHDSIAVNACIAELNGLPNGPSIQAIPLPSQSQFLNVIESVFAGVKRAVIFNSNYRSENEMKTAISNHLIKRNQFYRENPKRAGDKIWDRELFNVKEVDSGLFKRV